MKKTAIFLLCASLLTAAGCSNENAKRLGYESMRNMELQECLKDSAIDCPDRESYNDYQRKREAAKSPDPQ